METSSRDRISVDLHGLKAALMERAQALDVSPSWLVRKVLEEALGRPPESVNATDTSKAKRPGDRARLCLRFGREEAEATLRQARSAGLSPGEYVAELVAGVPVLLSGGRRADHIAALTASNAELSTLSRNIYHLTQLLRQAEAGPALFYRDMLDTLNTDIRDHLTLASRVLVELRPRTGACRSG